MDYFGDGPMRTDLFNANNDLPHIPPASEMIIGASRVELEHAVDQRLQLLRRDHSGRDLKVIAPCHRPRSRRS